MYFFSHSSNARMKWGSKKCDGNENKIDFYEPACAAKWSAELPSLSGLLTSMPGKWRKSSRKFVRFVEQI